MPPFMGKKNRREREKNDFSADSVPAEVLATQNEVISFILNFHHCRINQLLPIPPSVRARVYFGGLCRSLGFLGESKSKFVN